MTQRGRYIAFEGWEASGKSTQAQLLAKRLDAVLTREPGGTDLGERIRELLLGDGPPPTERAEALLFAAVPHEPGHAPYPIPKTSVIALRP